MLGCIDRHVAIIDIDGVLAPYGRPDPTVLDAECVARLAELGRHARLVLASSWPMEAVEEHLGALFDDELNYEERRTYAGRPRAMERYLAEHPEVTAWVSIDDDRIVEAAERDAVRDLCWPPSGWGEGDILVRSRAWRALSPASRLGDARPREWMPNRLRGAVPALSAEEAASSWVLRNARRFLRTDWLSQGLSHIGPTVTGAGLTDKVLRQALAVLEGA